MISTTSMLERANLGRPRLRNTGTKIAASEPTGHDRRMAHRPDDRARQVRRVQRDQQHRSPEACRRCCGGSALGRVGIRLRSRRGAALSVEQQVEVAAHRVDTPLSCCDGRDATR
jgi:hypothetical protein